MQWSEVITDKSLKDLPYKIELDRYGNILMSPASNRHGRMQLWLFFFGIILCYWGQRKPIGFIAF